MSMFSPNDRFQCLYTQRDRRDVITEIWMDRYTGVNYLYHKDQMSGGFTPLLNTNGTLLIGPSER